jgi:hypothetical protein
MPATIEASTVLYLYTAETSMTAIASRLAQRREQLARVREQAIPAEVLRLDQWQEQAIPAGEQAISTELLWLAQRRLQSVTLETQAPQPRGQGVTTVSRGTMSVTPDASVRSEEPKTQADRIVAQLVQFERMDADWDGDGAAKPLQFSLKDARTFIRALAPESVMPRPALHADGHAILFLRGPDTYAELEFLGKKRIGFYARRGEQEWSDEIDFDGHTLPVGLSQIGFAI